MVKFNALELIPAVATIRGNVIENRAACRTDFARSLHDTVLSRLDEMAADLDDEVATEREIAAHLGTPEGDFFYEIYHVCTSFEHRWIRKGPISILDAIYELVVIEDDRFPFPLEYTEVPASELEGLDKFLHVLAQSTGVRFVAART